MIALYIHPPKTITSGEDLLFDSPALVAWWEREEIVGNAVLVPAEQLRPVLAGTNAVVEAALRGLEDAHCVMLVRRS